MASSSTLAVETDVKKQRRRSTLDAPMPGSPPFDKPTAEITPPRAKLSAPPSPGASPMRRPTMPPEADRQRNHPSNVQIQYVSPAAVERPPDSRRASVDLGRPSLESNTGLKRTVSIRSNRSTLSLASSNGSLGDGMPKGQRRVTPLYNLDVHSLLQTVVTDAGTDAKVALFKKRGIEVVNCCVLEAYELSASGEAVEFAASPGEEDGPDSGASAPSTSTADATANTLLSKLKRFSFKPAKAVDPAQPRPESPVALFRAKTAQPPVADGEEAVVPPRQHASGYRWKIRRWLRKPETITLAAATELTAPLSVEWRKRKRTVEQRRAARDRRSEAESISAGITRSSTHLSVAPPTSQRSSLDLGTRTPDTLASRSPSMRSVSRFGDDDIAAADDDEDSDPEDSESPWQCHLIVPERQDRQPSYMSATPPRRVLLASFGPHPYHPKLVGQLAMPGEMTDIELDDEGAFALEIPDLKDIICVTLLHLVIRESLGGIAKRRAGDGAWRIGTGK